MLRVSKLALDGMLFETLLVVNGRDGDGDVKWSLLVLDMQGTVGLIGPVRV